MRGRSSTSQWPKFMSPGFLSRANVPSIRLCGSREPPGTTFLRRVSGTTRPSTVTTAPVSYTTASRSRWTFESGREDRPLLQTDVFRWPPLTSATSMLWKKGVRRSYCSRTITCSALKPFNPVSSATIQTSFLVFALCASSSQRHPLEQSDRAGPSIVPGGASSSQAPRRADPGDSALQPARSDYRSRCAAREHAVVTT